MRIFVNFDVKTDPNTDLILTQMRQNLAEPQLPVDVRNYGVSVVKARSSPLMILALYLTEKDVRFHLHRELREHQSHRPAPHGRQG